MSHETALELLSTSSVLIGAGPRDGRKSLRGLIPAKLLEYLSTDLPIIYVSQMPNDGADLLREYPGCHVIPVDDADGVERALMESTGKHHPREVAGLSWHSRAAELAAVLDGSG